MDVYTNTASRPIPKTNPYRNQERNARSTLIRYGMVRRRTPNIQAVEESLRRVLGEILNGKVGMAHDDGECGFKKVRDGESITDRCRRYARERTQP